MDTPNSLIFRYLATLLAVFVFAATNAGAAEGISSSSPYFNPETGFRPAQSDLSAIFLQLAGSLEYHGSPEPYIRHVMAENTRILAKFKAATGKEGSSRPEFLTDQYLEKIVANWKQLAPGLKLEPLCRESGRNIRFAIMGSWNMTPGEVAGGELSLEASERATLQALLEKPYFMKADMAPLDRFYGSPAYEKLSDTAKSHLSRRVWRGTLTSERRAKSIESEKGGTIVLSIFSQHQRKLVSFLNGNGPSVNADTLKDALVLGLKLGEEQVTTKGLELTEADALLYSHLINAGFTKRFAYIRSTVKVPQEAEDTIQAVYAMPANLLVLAHSEVRAALLEKSIP